MRVKRWKQVFIETYDGQILAIEHQKYPPEASDFNILYLRDKPGWWWIDSHNGYAKANGQEVMRVHYMYQRIETWRDKIWRRITKNWVHRLR